MKLYRGYQQRPRILVDKLAQEWEELNAVKQRESKDAKDLADLAKRMGSERLMRWAELEKVARPQFFTPDESMARGFAGENGFVMTIEVPDDLADKHYEGYQMMAKDGKPRPVDNYVFSGQELAVLVNNHPSEVIERERERAEKETPHTSLRDIAEGRTPTKPLNETIRGIGDLSSRDQNALAEFRRNFGKESRTSTPLPTEGKPHVK